MIDDIKTDVSVLKNNGGEFKLETVELKSIIDRIPELPYIYERFSGTDVNNTNKKFLEIADEISGIISDEIIVVDRWLSEELHRYPICKVLYIPDKKDWFLLCSSKEIGAVEIAAPKTRRLIIKSMVSNYLGKENIFFNSFGIRRGIVSISDYVGISSKINWAGATRYNLGNHYYIISPITKMDFAQMAGLSKEKFIENIIHRDDFKNLVGMILENRTEYTFTTEKEIIDKYIELIAEYYDIIQEDEVKAEDSCEDV